MEWVRVGFGLLVCAALAYAAAWLMRRAQITNLHSIPSYFRIFDLRSSISVQTENDMQVNVLSRTSLGNGVDLFAIGFAGKYILISTHAHAVTVLHIVDAKTNETSAA
jgi:hypothetical protein